MSKYQEITNLYNQIGISSTPNNLLKPEEPPYLSDDSFNSLPTKYNKNKRQTTSALNEPKPKKKRFMWDELLHKKFLASIFDFGLKTISPKWILQSLNVFPAELTSENIKSHLQKYRLNSQKSRDAFINCYNETIRTVDSQPHNYYQAPSTKFNLYPISLPEPSSSAITNIDSTTATSGTVTSNSFNPFRDDDDDSNYTNNNNNNNSNQELSFQQCLNNFLKQKELYDEAVKQLLSSYKLLIPINTSNINNNNNNNNIESPPILPSSSSMNIRENQLIINTFEMNLPQSQQQQQQQQHTNSISSPTLVDDTKQNLFFTLPSPSENSFSLYGNETNISPVEIVPMIKQIEMHKQIKTQHDIRFLANIQQNDDISVASASGKDDTFDFLN